MNEIIVASNPSSKKANVEIYVDKEVVAVLSPVQARTLATTLVEAADYEEERNGVPMRLSRHGRKA